MSRKRYIIASILVIAANYALDRITKYLAEAYLRGREPIRFLYNTVILVFAENEGAFLSAGSTWPRVVKYVVLLALPIAVCLFGSWYIMFRESSLTKALILACVIGGGFGNLIDRLFNNFTVIDFLNFGIGSFRTGILNIADLSVTFGVIAFILYEIADKKKHIGGGETGSPDR